MKHKRRNIVLIGFMGSGKTTLGLKLSYLLRMPVEDTDKLIERQEGRSITQIFADDGESYFRELETELLRKCGEQKYERILSVGGGTPVNPVNRPLLHQCGTVVYLRVSPEVVYERLKNDTTRPLLQCEDPLTGSGNCWRSGTKSMRNVRILYWMWITGIPMNWRKSYSCSYGSRKTYREKRREKDENSGDQRTESEFSGNP